MKLYNPQEFVEQHEHVNYCEAIIYPNGYISYAIPSHTNVLLRIYKRIKNIPNTHDVMDYISPSDYSSQWLCNQTGCCMIWFNSIIKPDNINESQIDTINYLCDKKCINFSYSELEFFQSESLMKTFSTMIYKGDV